MFERLKRLYKAEKAAKTKKAETIEKEIIETETTAEMASQE